MATEVLAGTLPGFETHTYWMPPVYFLLLAAVFAFFEPGLIVVRLVSVALGVLALLMTCALSRRVGLGRWLSLLPVAFLAADTLFLRASLIGRMEILTILLTLTALFLALDTKPQSAAVGARRDLLTGFVAALAALSHPVGVAAPVAVLLARVFFPPPENGALSQRRRIPWPLLLGMALPALAWGVYLLQSPGDFAAQWGAQMARKSKTGSVGLAGIRGTLTVYAILYAPVPKSIIALYWLGGIGGLYALGRSRRPLFLLLLCQALLLVIVTMNQEYHYPVYLAPLGCIGIAHLIGAVRHESRAWQAAGIAAMAVMVWFTLSGLEHRTTLAYGLNVLYRERTDYADWTRKISDVLPPGARVLLSATPDPYLGLCGRRDLILHAFLPEDVPMPAARIAAFLSSHDYVVVDKTEAGTRREIPLFVRTRCDLVTKVGEANGQGYIAHIYRVRR